MDGRADDEDCDDENGEEKFAEPRPSSSSLRFSDFVGDLAPKLSPSAALILQVLIPSKGRAGAPGTYARSGSAVGTAIPRVGGAFRARGAIPASRGAGASAALATGPSGCRTGPPLRGGLPWAGSAAAAPEDGDPAFPIVSGRAAGAAGRRSAPAQPKVERPLPRRGPRAFDPPRGCPGVPLRRGPPPPHPRRTACPDNGGA
jgi:hypothetical protein